MGSADRLASVICVLLVLSAAWAGCLDPGQRTQAPDPISLREAVEHANGTVQAWSANASLVVASAFEGGEDSPAHQDRESQQREEDDEARFPSYADPLPGDGRAPQWVLVFLAGDETRTLRVTARTAEWLDEAGQRAGAGVQALEAFELDSTDAVQRAIDEDADFSRIVASGDVSVFSTLGSAEEGPRWQLRAQSQAFNEQTIVYVDARTGEVSNGTEGSNATSGGQSSDGPDSASTGSSVSVKTLARSSPRSMAL